MSKMSANAWRVVSAGLLCLCSGCAGVAEPRSPAVDIVRRFCESTESTVSMSALFFKGDGTMVALGPVPEGIDEIGWRFGVDDALRLETKPAPPDMEGSMPLSRDVLWVVFQGDGGSLIVHFDGAPEFRIGPRLSHPFVNKGLAARLRELIDPSPDLSAVDKRYLDHCLGVAAGQPDNGFEFTEEEERWKARQEHLKELGLHYEMKPAWEDTPSETQVLSETESYLDRGGDPDKIVDEEEEGFTTRLHLAAERGHWAVARALLVRGAKPDVRDSANQTPLHLAAYCGYENIAALLLIAGADVSARSDAAGKSTPLTAACDNWGALELVKDLVGAGADVNARGEDGGSALAEAAYSGSLEIVAYLLSKGADVNPRNKRGMTPLDIAMGREHVRVAKFLREHGGK